MARTLIVVTGGDLPTPDVARRLPAEVDRVIAADSGLVSAQLLGLHVDLVVGDLDSVDRGALTAAEEAGAEVQRHPAAKDATDLALALDAAAGDGPAEVVVVGGHGGRLDHFLANALLLAAAPYAHLRIEAHMGPATVTVVRDEVALTGEVGEVVSLLPAHGTAHGVRTSGLLWGLDGVDLGPGTTHGVSNEFREPHAQVGLERGVLLAVQPGVLGTHTRRHAPTNEEPT